MPSPAFRHDSNPNNFYFPRNEPTTRNLAHLYCRWVQAMTTPLTDHRWFDGAFPTVFRHINNAVSTLTYRDVPFNIEIPGEKVSIPRAGVPYDDGTFLYGIHDDSRSAPEVMMQLAGVPSAIIMQLDSILENLELHGYYFRVPNPNLDLCGIFLKNLIGYYTPIPMSLSLPSPHDLRQIEFLERFLDQFRDMPFTSRNSALINGPSGSASLEALRWVCDKYISSDIRPLGYEDDPPPPPSERDLRLLNDLRHRLQCWLTILGTPVSSWDREQQILANVASSRAARFVEALRTSPYVTPQVFDEAFEPAFFDELNILQDVIKSQLPVPSPLPANFPSFDAFQLAVQNLASIHSVTVDRTAIYVHDMGPYHVNSYPEPGSHSVPLGPFNIQVNLADEKNFCIKNPDGGKIRVPAFNPIYLLNSFRYGSNGNRILGNGSPPNALRAGESDSPHPHMSADDINRICLGDATEDVASAFAAFDLVRVFDLIESVLNNYNPESPIYGLEEFDSDWTGPDSDSCDFCGEHYNPDDLHRVHNSNARGCGNCTGRCADTSNVYSREDLTLIHYHADGSPRRVNLEASSTQYRQCDCGDWFDVDARSVPLHLYDHPHYAALRDHYSLDDLLEKVGWDDTPNELNCPVCAHDEARGMTNVLNGLYAEITDAEPPDDDDEEDEEDDDEDLLDDDDDLDPEDLEDIMNTPTITSQPPETSPQA